jgi:hypothetical protein
VRGAEGVHDEQVAQRGVFLRAVASTFFFSPLLKRQFSSSTTSPSATSKPPSTQSRIRRTGLPSLAAITSATGFSEFSSAYTPFFRTAEVRGDHHLGAGLEAVLDGRHGRGDAGIGGDLAVLDRHVEVGADEDALAGEVEIGQCA